MPDMVDIQNALDTAVLAEFSSAPAVPVLMGNQSYVEYTAGTATFVRTKISFIHSKITTLGDQCYRRHHGQLLFFIHYRVGTGDRDRTVLQTRIESAFVAQYIGGATLKDLLLVASTEVADWAITGLQIPFYFDEVTS